MTHSAPPDRRYADDHLAELTERQRRVLDLIVAGKTNAQIGEALGITLDGANDGAPGHIWLQGRANVTGLPESARTGQRIAVNGHDAYRSEANGLTSITWADNDLVIVLSADALASDELLKMAESVGR